MERLILVLVSIIFLLLFIIGFRFKYGIAHFTLNSYDLLIAAIISFLFDVMRYIPWRYVSRKTGQKVTLSDFLTMLTFFGLLIVPLGLDSLAFISSSDLKRIKKYSTPIYLSLLLSSTAAIAFLALVFSFIVAPQYTFDVIGVFAILYTIISLLKLEFVWNYLEELVRKISKKGIFHKYRKTFLKIESQIEISKKVQAFLSNKDSILLAILFFPTLILEGALLYLSLLALNIHVSIVFALFIFFFSNTIGILSTSPMGLGAMDTVSILLMEGAGIPGIEAVTAQFLFRVFNLVEPLLIGYGALLSYKRNSAH